MSGGAEERRSGGVDVAILERELHDLWKQMAGKSQQDGEQAVTRACVHNLVVYAPGERSETELSRALSDLMVDQPGRVILILADPKNSTDSLSAWVNAQCHRTSGERQQVCSEQIVVRAAGPQVRNLSSLVIPLLVPDLPVFFWWRDDLSAEWTAFEEVVENADRVIVDSARFAQPVETLRRLASIANSLRGSTSFSDLNWNRLTPWRQMTAGFFDHAVCGSALASLTAVDIQAHSPTGFSTQALMLASWLAARLGWKPLSGGDNILLTDAKGRRIQVRIFVRPPVEGSPRGLSTVTLRAESPAVTLHMALDPETRYLRGAAETAGARAAERTSRAGRAGEEECLAGEMEILGPDRMYEEAMSLLERIL